MLSDAELWRAFTPSGAYMDATLAKLRAVEAAVRADQIEKDAGIAEESDPGWSVSRSDGLTTAEAIRAQLDDR